MARTRAVAGRRHAVERNRDVLVDVGRGDAGLLVERLGFLADRRAVEFSQSCYRGDIYDFVAELSGQHLAHDREVREAEQACQAFDAGQTGQGAKQGVDLIVGHAERNAAAGGAPPWRTGTTSRSISGCIASIE